MKLPDSTQNGRNFAALLSETAKIILQASLPVLSARLVAWLERKFPSPPPTSPTDAERKVERHNGDS